MKAAERVKVTLAELERERQAVEGLRVQIEEVEDDDRPRAAEKQALEKRWRAKRAHVAHVDRVLAALGKDERTVLEVFFCSGLRPTAAMMRLQGEVNASEATVYRIRRKALREFAVRMGYLDK